MPQKSAQIRMNLLCNLKIYNKRDMSNNKNDYVKPPPKMITFNATEKELEIAN